jgi:hypothetical protein
MGPKSQSSPSRQHQLKQNAPRRAVVNRYSKENEIKRKAERDAKHEEGKLERMCERFRASEKYRKDMTIRVDFGTKNCQRCCVGSSYKKGHHKTCHKNPNKEKYEAPTSLELELLLVASPSFLPSIPEECKQHFIRLRLLDRSYFSPGGTTPQAGGRTATIETAAMVALPSPQQEEPLHSSPSQDIVQQLKSKLKLEALLKSRCSSQM